MSEEISLGDLARLHKKYVLGIPMPLNEQELVERKTPKEYFLGLRKTRARALERRNRLAGQVETFKFLEEMLAKLDEERRGVSNEWSPLVRKIVGMYLGGIDNVEIAKVLGLSSSDSSNPGSRVRDILTWEFGREVVARMADAKHAVEVALQMADSFGVDYSLDFHRWIMEGSSTLYVPPPAVEE